MMLRKIITSSKGSMTLYQIKWNRQRRDHQFALCRKYRASLLEKNADWQVGICCALVFRCVYADQ